MGVIYKNGIKYFGGGSGFESIQKTELPTASASEVENIYQYVGATNASYTNGYFYECVEDSGTYSWVEKEVQDNSKQYSEDDSSFTDVADADYVPIYDSSASAKKKTLWSNIKSILKTYFDTLYSTVKSSASAASGGTTLSLVTTGEKYTWNNKVDNDEVINYSTTEKVVGTWIDGKPIYQKTFTSTMPNVTTDGTTAINTINLSVSVSDFILFKGVIKRNDGVIFDIPRITTPAISGGGIRMHWIIGRTNSSTSYPNTIQICSTEAAFNGISVYVTIQYTKTTD